MRSEKDKRKAEFGDFQTPRVLAEKLCSVLSGLGLRPSSIIEPTCGTGSLLLASLLTFPQANHALALDINPSHVSALSEALGRENLKNRVRLVHGNFFATNWGALVADLPEPLLVIGNPPWVTNSALGSLGSTNLPEKTNFHGLQGMDAVTGKSNFDVSEWMLLKMVDWFRSKCGVLAMLCKTSVARKVLRSAWGQASNIAEATTYGIDAASNFGATVDCCLLVCRFERSPGPKLCKVFSSVDDISASRSIGFHNGKLLADIDLHRRWEHLEGRSSRKWRSGAKHDCARVMEMKQEDGHLRNGLGEIPDIEDDLLFPLQKSSDLANGTSRIMRFVLITQRCIGEDTQHIRAMYPKTWRYLVAHADQLDSRGSSIYKGRPRFSIFGVGDYTFSPYKVAISALYKKLEFRVVGTSAGKPIILDDTCNFLPCRTSAEAVSLAGILNSQPAQEFYQSLVFWDEKRPITIQLLGQLNLDVLAGQSQPGSVEHTLPLFAREDDADYRARHRRAQRPRPTRTG